jgi:hypothetical protein
MRQTPRYWAALERQRQWQGLAQDALRRRSSHGLAALVTALHDKAFHEQARINNATGLAKADPVYIAGDSQRPLEGIGGGTPIICFHSGLTTVSPRLRVV